MPHGGLDFDLIAFGVCEHESADADLVVLEHFAEVREGFGFGPVVPSVHIFNAKAELNAFVRLPAIHTALFIDQPDMSATCQSKDLCPSLVNGQRQAESFGLEGLGLFQVAVV